MTELKINQMSESEAKEALLNCCHSHTWVNQVLMNRPFVNKDVFFENTKTIWFSLSHNDWLEAFDAHPKIGDLESLKTKYHSTKNISHQEQSEVESAEQSTLASLSSLNQEYLERFGFVFIVFATGKTATQMLGLLKSRIENTKEEELKTAALEQIKITHLRMETLL